MANIVLIPNELSGLNYSIAPSVASNNLTVAIKDAAGANPTSTSPCVFRIGGSERILSTSLSVTKNAGTNWCGLGSTAAAGVSGFATLEQDLFVYIVWNTNTSALDVLWSRIAHATLYSDFSATTTAQNYGAINATAPASTDEVVNIGRFAATLSAGAGYTWTVPTFTTTNLIQRPIFETRLLSYAPTVAGYSSAPTNTVYLYRVLGNMTEVFLREAADGTSNNTAHTYTAPFTCATRTNMSWIGSIPIVLNSGTQEAAGVIVISSASNSMSVFRSALAAWTASGASRIFYVKHMFEI